MKKSDLIMFLFICAVGLTSFSSCKGSAGKKAASKTFEYIEKKAVKPAASTVEREAGQVERVVEENADDVYRSRRGPRRLRHSYSNDDNEYDDNATQAYYVACPYCNGVGVVYVTDIYGNVLVDYYGNPQTTTCSNCGGGGQVVVYQ